ncbi:peptide transporter [Thermococcus celericrescens]|uniref:dolichyl-phosphooligosaccharide-protein glycotransferase n=1 Tax=Thermococcus celericrescens TaxID=227598 RepID=A0A124EBF7_9EURY|nr:STT3 domain-containing protein [Thermococcus celericrescens]KUH33877.1 peptide transporter [Thermococcus celericrescens]
MVKTEIKEKRKKKGENTPLPGYYQKFKSYGLPLIALLLAYLGFKLRNITSNYKTFLDPDTFFHYEMYRQAITEWIPQYFAYADPPAGVKAGGYLGLYTVQAIFYKIVSIFGYDQLGAFKLWPPFVGAMTIVAVYLLGRKLHSNWAGLWAAAFMMFSYANFSKTYSGNNRGEGPFMMFFLYAVFFLLVYLDERKWNPKKILSGVLFLLTSVLYMAVWTGSQFGVGILLLFAGLTVVVFFTFGMMDVLRRFVRDFFPLFGLSLVIGLVFSYTRLVGIRSFLVFAIEGLVALSALVAIMIYGERVGLNYSDKKHRFGTIIAIAILGFLAFYGYFGRDLLKFLGGATQSNPLYQTVAELAKTDWKTIAAYYSVKSNDAIIFILSAVGFITVAARFVRKLVKNDLTGHKEIFLVSYYAGSLYLLLLAVRFVFQASGAILLLAGVAIGEAFLFVETMKESATTKALYAVLLIILFLPLPIIGAQYTGDIAKSTAKAQGSVPAEWMNTLNWLKENSHPLDSATSWWDYGYWIESSLLSHRRSATDGGHAYDRRYIVADFFSHYGNESEQDFEAWELNYMIVWQQDIYKFNAISYLGGAINYYEYSHIPMFQVVPMQYVKYANESGKTVVYLKTAAGDKQPAMTVDLARGQIIQGRGDIPYVLYLFGNYGILAYHKIAFSNFVRLVFHMPYSLEPWDAQKLFANFKPVHNDEGVSTYEFRPFAVYRIDRYENGTWKTFYSTMGGGKLPLGEQKLRLWISAFGRDVKDAALVFEAYNGTELIKRETLAEGLGINHLNETPVEVSLFVPNATKYRFVLIQDGPVGVLNGEPRVNGKVANPTYLLGEGQSGQLELKAAFRKDYSNVQLALRASIVYYVAPNGKDIYQDKFYLEPHQDIITYVPVKELSVKAGDNVITAQASMPSDVFSAYIEKLYQKYGEDKVVIVKKRVEPVFITKKEYVIWEG